MKTFLHVGLHKTATKYLQRHLFPRMGDVAYIGRPFTQENHAFNKLQYADDTLFEAEELELELASIKRAFDDCSAIVISDENLSGFPLYNYVNRGMIAKRLAQVLTEAEVIVFLRNQADLILSLYNQYVKIKWFSHPLDDRFLSGPGTGTTLDECIDANTHWSREARYISTRAKVNVEHFRFSRLLDLYQQHFAVVHVYLYEDFVARPDTTLRSLADLLGTEAPATTNQPPENPSLGASQLHQQMLFNRLIALSSRLDSPTGKLLARGLALATPDAAARNRAHVRRLLESSGIAEDNLRVDSKWKCGMSRHASRYFEHECG